MRAAPMQESLTPSHSPPQSPNLLCSENLGPGSLIPNKTVRLDCLSPTPLDRSDSLVGRKRVLPSFIGKTFYPRGSPTPSEEADQFMDRIEDVVEKLEEYIQHQTAEWRRENTDYCEGETPRTSQESNASQKSDFDFSQRSVSEIASPEEVAEFIFHNEEHAFLREALQPFMGRVDLGPEEFKASATTLLMAEPKALVHVLRKVLERARQKARKERMENDRRRAVKRRLDQEAEMDYVRTEFPDLH